MDPAFRREVAAKALKMSKVTADEALSRLPGIYLSVARLQERMKRCKHGSQLYQKLYRQCVALENEGGEMSSIVRMAVIVATV